MRTPVLLLLDDMLSQDVGGIQATLRSMRHELPPGVVASYLPPEYSVCQPNFVDPNVIVQHLSIYLQTFPQQAGIASQNDGSLPLHFAASLGDVTLTQVVWQAYPAGACSPNEKGKIPLHYASREGRTALVNFLLQVAPQTAAMASGKDKLALHFAAGEGHLDVVRSLLHVYPQGAALPSAKGKLPLHFCSRWGHEAVAMVLLPYYPDAIRALDWEGSLPLHEACREGQASMARFLIDRFPEALATANLRNEVPLFPAVRAGSSLDMILDLLQAWPAGAAHVLQHVTVDDRIASWGPIVVEALVRASVECWDGFVPWQSRPPAILRLHASVNHVLPEASEEDNDAADSKNNSKIKKKKDKKEKKDKPKKEKKDKPKKEIELGTIEDRQPRLWTAGPFTSTRVERIPIASFEASNANTHARTTRCKSPILDRTDETALRPRKSARRSLRHHHSTSTEDFTTEDSDDTASLRSEVEHPVVFHPLQAALTAQASLPVLQHVQQLFPDTDLDSPDHDNRSSLHLALMHANLVRDESAAGGVDWIFANLFRPELALLREATRNALPLHDALHSRSSSRLINALLQANPSSAIEACGTQDLWEDEKPLALACEKNCDYSTIYLLLRADPGVVPASNTTTVATSVALV